MINPSVEPAVDSQGEAIQKKFVEFLENFILSHTDPTFRIYVDDKEPRKPVKIYLKQGEKLKANEKNTMYVDYEHLSIYEGTKDIRDAIQSEYYRFDPYLRRALLQFMVKNFPDYAKEKKQFFVSVFNMPVAEKIRDLRTNFIGRLISLSGTVTRTTEVRPELMKGAFRCLLCNTTVKSIEQQFKFTEPKICSNPNCSNRTRWELIVEDSDFVDWQKVRLQENANEIPSGSMPRSIDVVVRNEIVDVAKPGDRVIFTGMLVVVPDIISLLKPGERTQVSVKDEGAKKKDQVRSLDTVTGLRRLGVRDLSYKLCFIANCVQTQENKFGVVNIRGEDEEKLISPEEKAEINKLRNEPNIYSRMAHSLCPSIFGHEEVKRGLLLMLLGGITKKTKEGMKLRGDINVCIVGDPSTAKSQFLKYVVSFLPRAIYTSGKASSAAGLTATVTRDPETGEFCIDAGALMLADNGVCCIDEFDKMDIRDQVAIHEAMEQQTISIAKAGIHATLNARTSILAAANPVLGRYDKSKTLKYNVNLSPPIMSRFDLFFIIVDERNENTDFSIAKHILTLHQKKKASIDADFSMAQMQRYIRYAKSLKPKFTKEASEFLRNAYVQVRQRDMSYQKTAYRITVRQLESLIRLSEAVARVHLDESIKVEHVKEAERLLKKSIINVEQKDLELEQIEEALNTKKTTLAKEDKDTKIKVPYDEYSKIAKAMALHIKANDTKGDGIQQKALVEWYIKENIEAIETEAQAVELSKKLNGILQHMLIRDKLLIVSQAANVKEERFLSLNLNIDPTML